MTLVLLHGFTGAPASWHGVRAHLRGEARCEPIAGHAPELVATSATFAAEVDRLAARCPAGAHLCGYSLGARLALAIALGHPDRCARLTLVGVNPGLADPSARAARVAADARWIALLAEHGVARFCDAWEDQPMLARDPATRAIRRGHDARGLAHALRVLGLGAMPDWTPRLGELRAPVTVVVGEHDHAFRAHAARFPRARVVTIAGADHDVPSAAPAALAATLEEQP